MQLIRWGDADDGQQLQARRACSAPIAQALLVWLPYLPKRTHSTSLAFPGGVDGSSVGARGTA